MCGGRSPVATVENQFNSNLVLSTRANFLGSVLTLISLPSIRSNPAILPALYHFVDALDDDVREFSAAANGFPVNGTSNGARITQCGLCLDGGRFNPLDAPTEDARIKPNRLYPLGPGG
jgi:hypothetical protein